nr:MAG TPA: hypothetical protein [Caudoviricetes sp.]
MIEFSRRLIIGFAGFTWHIIERKNKILLICSPFFCKQCQTNVRIERT